MEHRQKQLRSLLSLRELEQHLTGFAGQRREIVAVYLFGSTATARSRPGSDIDIALMVNTPIPGLTRVAWETELSNALGKDVDLVVFSQAGVLLRHQILKYGKLLYEADALNRVQQEVRARAEYLDTRHLYKKLAA